MIRPNALRRQVAAVAMSLPLVAAPARVALAADVAAPAADATKAPAAAGTASTAPVADAVAIGTIRLAEDGARWENGYGEKFFQVVGTVTNDGKSPVGAVRIRVELLDESGEVVAKFDGWNGRAEALGDLDDAAARAELAELSPGPIAPGESDRFRSTFLADETPKFASHRVRVLTVLPPA